MLIKLTRIVHLGVETIFINPNHIISAWIIEPIDKNKKPYTQIVMRDNDGYFVEETPYEINRLEKELYEK